MSQLTVFGIGGLSLYASSVAGMGLSVKGDDDGLWYGVGLSYNAALGVYLWSVSSGSYPGGAINVSGKILGNSYYALDGAANWHQFVMTPTDTLGGYVWTDYAQSAVAPVVYAMPAAIRADDGLYIIDVDGYTIHKMGVSGGFWTELNQGSDFAALRAA
jgi:hypothetical protein